MKADQISQTAAFVAIKFYGLSRIERFQPLFDDSVVTFYEKLIRSLPAPLRYYHYWLDFDWIRRLYIWSEELLLPGDLLHIVARKWYIQRMATQLVDEGYDQLIVLGAGFDHLSYHFTQHGIDCFEFDAPKMAALKRHFLSNCYPGQPHPDIITSHLPADDLKSEFSDHPRIDPSRKTIIVAEGFFDYLAPETVSRCLQQIRQYFSHNPALISTHFALNELPSFYRWVFKSSVKLVNEQLQFDRSIDSYKHLLSEAEFEISQLHDAQEISTEIQKVTHTNLSVLDGFYVLLAHQQSE